MSSPVRVPNCSRAPISSCTTWAGRRRSSWIRMGDAHRAQIAPDSGIPRHSGVRRRRELKWGRGARRPKGGRVSSSKARHSKGGEDEGESLAYSQGLALTCALAPAAAAASPTVVNGGGTRNVDGEHPFSQFGLGLTRSTDGSVHGDFNCRWPERHRFFAHGHPRRRDQRRHHRRHRELRRRRHVADRQPGQVRGYVPCGGDGGRPRRRHFAADASHAVPSCPANRTCAERSDQHPLIQEKGGANMRSRSRLLVFGAVATLSATLLLLATLAVAAPGGAQHVRWDIVSLTGGAPPGPINAGGHADAKAPDGTYIRLMGNGTFVAPPGGNGGSSAVTGGGTWETFNGPPSPATSTGSGTYEVTELTSWEFANFHVR